MQLTEKEFLEKIETHKGIIYKVTRIYFENQDDREDLFQEIILQTWKSLTSFEGKSKFSTWLYRIALNTAIVFFKKEKKRSNSIREQQLQPITTEDDTNEKETQLAHFYKAVYQLDKIEKAIILQYIDGLSGDEISKNLGLSPVNTRVKLNRTKKKIQNIIKQKGYEF